MVICTLATFQSIDWSEVSKLPSQTLNTHGGKGGRKILGLSKDLIVQHRTGKALEVGICNSKEKVRLQRAVVRCVLVYVFFQMPALTDPRTRVLLDSRPTRRLAN